jgi:hypothetical protein
MDAVAYGQAMAAFCRQQARFEDQHEDFWLAEASGWERRFSDKAPTRSRQSKARVIAIKQKSAPNSK